MKEVAVLGLGDFGMALVRALQANKVRVLAVDLDESRVESVRNEIKHVVVADMTQATALQQLGLRDMDAVVVATSEPLATSVLAVLRLKDLGVQRIIAKAENEDHAKVLRALGVSDVVIPENDSAVRLANKISWTNVVEMVALSPGYAIMELSPPAAVVGKTLRTSRLREDFRVEVLAIREGAGAPLEAIPTADRVITRGCTVVVFGADEDLARLRKESAVEGT